MSREGLEYQLANARDYIRRSEKELHRIREQLEDELHRNADLRAKEADIAGRLAEEDEEVDA